MSIVERESFSGFEAHGPRGRIRREQHSIGIGPFTGPIQRNRDQTGSLAGSERTELPLHSQSPRSFQGRHGQETGEILRIRPMSEKSNLVPDRQIWIGSPPVGPEGDIYPPLQQPFPGVIDVSEIVMGSRAVNHRELFSIREELDFLLGQIIAVNHQRATCAGQLMQIIQNRARSIEYRGVPGSELPEHFGEFTRSIFQQFQFRPRLREMHRYRSIKFHSETDKIPQ